jgi:hypothetical protein
MNIYRKASFIHLDELFREERIVNSQANDDSLQMKPCAMSASRCMVRERLGLIAPCLTGKVIYIDPNIRISQDA